MKKPYERLIEYANIPSASDENSNTCPSTQSQFVLAQHLEREMKEIGIQDVRICGHGYVYGRIPATVDCDTVIGFIAHMDVVSEVPCEEPKLRVINKYDGKDILLNDAENIVMSPDEYPSLLRYIGKDLLVTDGTTILGADDKAGIAEILTMAEYLITHPEIKHGTVMIAFTPDEEIGRGADLFDVNGFGCDFAYTVDGGAFGEVDFETFNAYSARVSISGKSIHPGSAKDKMINSMDVACEFHSMLPAAMKPQHTEGYEGFIHLCGIEGSIEKTEMAYIVRDHDIEKLLKKVDIMKACETFINKKYGDGTLSLTVKESYRNMAEKIKDHMHLVENAFKAIESLGGTPVSNPVRGGTDGARLSFMGLPCPNLGTGSHNHHGRFEYACCDDMELCAMTLVRICELYAAEK